MNKIRVGFVINDLLLGGAQRVVLDVASRLDTDKYTPIVYRLNEKNEKKNLIPQFNEKGIPIKHVEGRTICAKIRRLQACLKHDDISVVHCHLPNSVMVGAVASLLRKTPFIIHEHQTHLHHSWKIRLAYRLLRPFSFVTLCYSPTDERELFGSMSILASPPQRIMRRSYTVLNAIDVEDIHNVRRSSARTQMRERLGVPDDMVVIASVGRLVAWKGHECLIEAFAALHKKYPNTCLVIAGEGPERYSLEQQIAQLGLEERVQLLGGRNDIANILAAADVFSLAYTYAPDAPGEAIGIAGLEAMAAGLPVVIARYGSADLFIEEGRTGMIVAPWSVNELAETLHKLCVDESLRIALGKNAYADARERLDIHAILPVYERIYELAV